MVLSPRGWPLVALLALLCFAPAVAHNNSQDVNRQRAIQALNRLTFGPRPGDIDRVLAMGLDKWLDQQLHPESIDDHQLEARLASFRTLRMSPRELVENFPPPPLIRAVANGREELPRELRTRAIYEAQLERFREHKDKTSVPDEADAMMSPHDASDVDTSHVLSLAPDQRLNALLKIPPPEQVNFLASMKGGMRQQFLDGMSPQDRETAIALANPPLVVASELMQAKILRATYSQRQLLEVMTDFWMNHFNVFIGKGVDRYELTSYERDVIRPHALGKFEDLLVATAQSPAMLFYLDNWLSVGPDSDFARGIRPGFGRNSLFRTRVVQASANRRGLNENYGRELMELHTLGVNGGYTQKDVTEVAKVFTGWTLKQPREGGGFVFNPRMHEPGTKIVLGHTIAENGEQEGYEVLHILAQSPATAHFICTQLALRFVSDHPSPQLVGAMATTFLEKDGDIREVLKTMLRSPEFWQPENYRAKVKTPLEFVVSALRATDAEVSDAAPLVAELRNLGMPLYGAQPPTGYSTKADAWVSSSALLGRMNFAIRLASGKFPGVQIAPPPQPRNGEDSQQSLAALESSLLAGDVSRQTHETIASRLQASAISQRRFADPPRSLDAAIIEALLLGSPEFQRR